MNDSNCTTQESFCSWIRKNCQADALKNGSGEMVWSVAIAVIGLAGLEGVVGSLHQKEAGAGDQQQPERAQGLTVEGCRQSRPNYDEGSEV